MTGSDVRTQEQIPCLLVVVRCGAGLQLDRLPGSSAAQFAGIRTGSSADIYTMIVITPTRYYIDIDIQPR